MVFGLGWVGLCRASPFQPPIPPAMTGRRECRLGEFSELSREFVGTDADKAAIFLLQLFENVF